MKTLSTIAAGAIIGTAAAADYTMTMQDYIERNCIVGATLIQEGYNMRVDGATNEMLEVFFEVWLPIEPGSDELDAVILATRLAADNDRPIDDHLNYYMESCLASFP